MKSEPYAAQTVLARSPAVIRWHALLRATAVLNLALWAMTAAAVAEGQVVLHAGTRTAVGLQLVLSAGYVLGCAYRSFLPVYDIPRLVLVDSRLSSVLVGRSVATVAELCFAAQWALILRQIAVMVGSPLGEVVSLAIVPLIVVAEIFSWHAVLTTLQRGHIVENSLWGVSAALMVLVVMVIGAQRLATAYPPTLVWCIGGAAYVGFMFFFDVPMYWSRWRADQRYAHQYPSVADGLVDVSRRWTVSYNWEDWKDEVLWMSLYFTIGVWVSISLVYAAAAFGT